MSSGELAYHEGDWFAVPLPSGGYGVGLVARVDQDGGFLGYFFGPRMDALPREEDIQGLIDRDAVLVGLVSALGLTQGMWPMLCRSNTWRREAWPVPAFGRISVDQRYVFRVEYSDDDVSQTVREVPISVEEARRLPSDGLYGYLALERHLNKLLEK